MKKIALAITFSALALSCKNEPVNYTLFSGVIKNQNSDEIIVRDSDNNVLRTIKVADNGVFADTIFNSNGNCVLYDGKESTSLYLKNGYDLKLTMDAKEFDESIVYTGKGSEENNYLAKKLLLKESMGVRDMKALFSLDEEPFIKKVTSFRDSISSLTKGLDKEFLASEELDNKYEYISLMKNYEGYHGMILEEKDFKVSDKFPNVEKGLKYDNEEHFKKSNQYKRIVLTDLFSKIEKKSEETKQPYNTVALEMIKNHKIDPVRQEAIKSLAYEVSAGNPSADDMYKAIMEISTDKKFKDKLTEKYTKMQGVKEGKPSPKFVNYENIKGGTSSLDDFKGKYVYIDVWATWCGPCKREIPFLKKMEEKYHGKNIEFVSISVDTKKDHDTWKAMVKKEGLKGIQLIADKDWQSDFVKDYAIAGIPTFILIDPAGNIVSANAPRPSSPDFVKLLDGLKL